MSLAWENMDVAKNSSSYSRDRNKIWHLNVPRKVKFFLWQGYLFELNEGFDEYEHRTAQRLKRNFLLV